MTGYAKINYLITLKRYEFNRAMRLPVGQRVAYYKAQTEWIEQEIRAMFEK